MDEQGFKQAKELFPLEYEMAAVAQYEQQRQAFVNYFNRNKIVNMDIDEYVLGKTKTLQIFSYALEFGLLAFGDIRGANAKKFGVYYKKSEGRYDFAGKFGSNYVETFINVKKFILSLLDAGERQDYQSIVANPISPMVKGKILHLYYPDIYFGIYTKEHLNYYLKAFDLDTEALLKSDEVYKRKALVDFKNHDSTMKSWSLYIFGVFLWKYFPKAPNAKSTKNEPKKIVDQLAKDETSIRKGNFGFGGESEHHQRLKEYIYNHPQVIGITKFSKRGMEHKLLSGDSLDVWFLLENGSEIAVEVKSHISSTADILRGLFQTIKYKATLDAENQVHGEQHDNLSYFVLEGKLNESNTSVRDKLGVLVFENVKPK